MWLGEKHDGQDSIDDGFLPIVEPKYSIPTVIDGVVFMPVCDRRYALF